jgi:hypothetical protein
MGNIKEQCIRNTAATRFSEATQGLLAVQKPNTFSIADIAKMLEVADDAKL